MNTSDVSTLGFNNIKCHVTLHLILFTIHKQLILESLET